MAHSQAGHLKNGDQLAKTWGGRALNFTPRNHIGSEVAQNKLRMPGMNRIRGNKFKMDSEKRCAVVSSWH